MVVEQNCASNELLDLRSLSEISESQSQTFASMGFATGKLGIIARTDSGSMRAQRGSAAHAT